MHTSQLKREVCLLQILTFSILKKHIFLLLVLAVCSTSYAGLIISFKHVFNQQGLKLNAAQYSSNTNEKIAFTKLKYYVGNISFVYESGKVYSDSKRYHLLDFEKPASMMWDLEGVPEGKIVRVDFGIGVDSLSNAEGLMDGDLDPMNGMYWAWSSGFINFKLEGNYGDKQNEFKYHIGGFLMPNQSYQSASIPLNLTVEKSKELAIDIYVNLASLFNNAKIESESSILSPSLKAKKYASKLPQMFSSQP